VDAGEEGVVLQNSPLGLPNDDADDCSATPRSVQLRGWLRELAGRLVCAREGVVLRASWQGLPQPGRLRDDKGTLRLQGGLCELASKLVCGQKGLVLPARAQGLPRPGRLRDDKGTLRLQRGLRELASKLVCAQEGVVLPAREQGLPACSGRLCVD